MSSGTHFFKEPARYFGSFGTFLLLIEEEYLSRG